jgi:hypothetical protein
MRDYDTQGGPAFPVAHEVNLETCRKGMSLRDWFAGQALAGWLANPVGDGSDANELARYSYKMADAMLKAREAK